jgi:chitinase
VAEFMTGRLPLFLLLTLTACATAPPPSRVSQQAPPPYRIVGYVSGRADFAAIDARKITHLNYAFAKVGGDDVVYFENAGAAEDLAALRALRDANPHLEIILSIGGWGAEWFSDAALTEESRCRFASSAVALVKEHGLDGLDIDWEFPGQRGAGNRFRVEDRENFTRLIELLRRDLDTIGGPGRYTLSIASSANRYFETTDVRALHPLVDWFNVMTYDMSGAWSPGTAHHAPLHRAAGTGHSTESFVRQYLDAGVPPSKIVVGVPFYAREWKWVVNRRSATGLGEPFDFFAGDVAAHRLRRDYLTDARFVRGWDPLAKAPFLWNSEAGTFVSYDDEESVVAKARFVREHGLGGIMYWEHRHDPEQRLLTAIASELLPTR